MKPRTMLAIAVVIIVVRVAFRLLGVDEHASVIAGMPLSWASWVLGPVVVIWGLAASIVAPVLVIGAALTSLQFASAKKSA
jgi:hypothetical protein